MEPDLIAIATQFGMAGLIAWMWLTERRAALTREQQLTEAHARLMEQHVELDSLMKLIGDNTRAVAAIEAGQRLLSVLLDRLIQSTSPLAEPSAPREAGADLPHPIPRRYHSTP